MAPVLLSPKGRDPHPDELKGMIAAVLNLLEDQHILHGEPLSPSPIALSWDENLMDCAERLTEIPYELANLLHIQPPKSKEGNGHDVEGFIRHLFGHL